MAMNIKMVINRKMQLSPIFYNNLQSFVEFKVDFHHIYLMECKEPAKEWNELPYIAKNFVIFDVLET